MRVEHDPCSHIGPLLLCPLNTRTTFFLSCVVGSWDSIADIDLNKEFRDAWEGEAARPLHSFNTVNFGEGDISSIH